ncbi:hypothetical protein BDV41DRAFT_557717 [Aspergillus transmontanensis]|uniref:Secreted protein n=1 Tax=Aspergillus transmontanensis TaxID=1034304 RepID=A0A5N6VE13_9EURO|nr:hypothetical protein BDV41DRAFT_557717 [Aspergillus transmontanensis]
MLALSLPGWILPNRPLSAILILVPWVQSTRSTTPEELRRCPHNGLMGPLELFNSSCVHCTYDSDTDQNNFFSFFFFDLYLTRNLTR